MSQHTAADPACLHLEHACQMRLEARDPRPLAADPRLAEHAAGCASCHSILVGFDALQAALLRPAPAMLPNRDLAAAVIAEIGRPRRSILAMPLARAGDWRWAVAATVLAAGVVGLGIARWGGDRPAEVASEGQRIANPQLQQSLADARAATWALAEETTAPAARVGRDLFNPGPTDLAPSPTLSLVDPAEPAAEALRSVGEGLEAGVRPLGGSARHAFGFLVPNLRRPAAADRPGEPAPHTF